MTDDMEFTDNMWGDGGGENKEFLSQCTVTTFAGSGEAITRDGIGTATAALSCPMAMCYSATSHSLLFIEVDPSLVRRCYLPATREMRTALSQSVMDGLRRSAAPAPILSDISALIYVIVSYALNDGTNPYPTST